MSYATNAYAASRIEELHRAGAEQRRAAARMRDPRIGLVIALLRRRDQERAAPGGREARTALVGRASTVAH